MYKFPQTVIYDSSYSPANRILYKINPRHYEYHGSEGPGSLSTGGWPGTEDSPSSRWLLLSDYVSGYQQNGEDVCYPIAYALQKLSQIGATPADWISSSTRTDSYKDITFSQSHEHQSSSRLPSVDIATLAKYDDTSSNSLSSNLNELLSLIHI